MKRLSFLIFLLIPFSAHADEGLDFFEKRIRPLLVKHCVQCHSAAEGKTEGGLALDHKGGWQEGGHSGPALVPGFVAKSLLVKAVSHTDPKLQMPKDREKLSEAEIRDLEKWIAMGAPDPRESPKVAKPTKTTIDWDAARKHWAFKPLAKPEVPKAGKANLVDAFLFDAMQKKGLEPAGQVDRATWLRRITYTLTGLPPTLKDIGLFLADKSPEPEAREKVIDRLLASNQYGVHWARHWLDVVRFGETSGAPGQWPIADAWKYRDYVVDAFNSDKPYPEFVREQLAGDLLGPDDNMDLRENLIATGYLAIARRFENKSVFHHLVIEDILDNMGQTFLGLSLACARCHDHKFDPVPTADYYALYGIFRSTEYPFPGKEHSKSPAGITVLGDDEKSKEIRALYKKLGDMSIRTADAFYDSYSVRVEHDLLRAKQKRSPAEEERFQKLKATRDKASSTIKKLKSETDKLRQKFPDDSGVDTIYAAWEGKPTNAKIQRRGEPYNQAAEVPRGFLRLLDHAQLPEDVEGSGRKELADWLASPDNALASRVIVNRVWHWHFGRGLVTTPNDFGTRGAKPTHPDLLDYLANWFLENGSSFKKLHRLLLTSEAFALAANSKNSDQDPANHLYSRFERRRLTAEEIRDTLLIVSGSLDPKLGGSHGKFVAPVAKRRYSQGSPWRPTYPEVQNQRSLYLFQHRSKPHPFLSIFDGADPGVTTPVRNESSTSLQGLFFLNAPLFHHCANKLATRFPKLGKDDNQRLAQASKLVLGRPPTKAEKALLEKILQSSPENPWGKISRVLLSSNAAIYID